jgi:glycosyltransferase involved in cell wall biosynthesis
MTTRYSIIIPTYNRLDVLPEVLEALEKQQEASVLEVVVVDDGSTDSTSDFLATYDGPLELVVLHQENQGPASARNRGVAQARGGRVAFLGDDTVPSPGWLAAHDRAWQAAGGDLQTAVIGYTAWHPRMRLTPFLRYINEQGPQFGYALIDNSNEVPFNFFYTSNLSLGRDLLRAEPFDLGFPYAAWEDIEVSYRLQKHGMRLIYAPLATVAHDHPTDLRRFSERQERAGYSAIVFHHRHPELASFLGVGPAGPPPIPSGRRQQLRECLARLLQKLPVETPRLWENLLRFHYIQGLHRGWHDLVEGDHRS